MMTIFAIFTNLDNLFAEKILAKILKVEKFRKKINTTQGN